ncbi:MAG: histidinol-phosphatase HisJ family protein [Clostridiales bacterium]|jgi:histidinol-phosphatase (PHP family)|nr:histidinol-phosphatase HisJ family protein [Clostridiales bacterium]
MLKFDYHTHTLYSPDSVALIDDMAERAIELGLTEYAITDHMDFSYPAAEFLNTRELNSYVNAVLAAREKFAGRIKILLGAELGLRPDCAAIGAQIAGSFDFDIIIGSMHEDLEGVDFGFAHFFEGRSKKQAYGIYFESILKTVRTCDCFDILGHMGYVERYGRYKDKTLEYADFKEIIDEILKTLIDKEIGIEINTSGYAYGIGRAHPQMEVLRRYRALGGEIVTVGSDAHRPGAIAASFDLAKETLKEAGIKYITRFDKRKPSFVRI